MRVALLLGVCVVGQGWNDNAADSGEDDQDNSDIDMVAGDADPDNTGWQQTGDVDRGSGEGVDAENPETGWAADRNDDKGVETKTVVIAVICAFIAGGFLAFLAARWYLGTDPAGHKYTGQNSGPPKKENKGVDFGYNDVRTGDPNEQRNPGKLPHGQIPDRAQGDGAPPRKNSKDQPVATSV